MRKKAVICAGLMLLSVMLCSIFCLADTAQTEPLSGGWEIIKHEAEELPEDAQAAFDKATENIEGAEYTSVALMATQIVAGTNYCILCQITPDKTDAKPKWSLVYIYADLQGNAEIMNEYELYIERHSMPGE